MTALRTVEDIEREAIVQHSRDGTSPAAGTIARFRLIPFDELRPGTQATYLVKRLIPRVGLTVVWGPPKCGKSFWAFDLTLHVALGWTYRDCKVKPGAVVYCAMEGAEGFKSRAEAFRQRFLANHAGPIPLHLMPAPMTLVADHSALIAAIRAQLGDGLPAAVVLDTLNRSLSGSESSDEDMSAYVRAADAIKEAFDCAVLVIHHCGIDGTRPRGHTALTGAADAQIAVKRDSGENIVVTVEHMKDGPEGEVFASRLESVEVGIDEDGDVISSCVVLPVDKAETSPVANLKISDRHKLAMKALLDSLIDSGEAAPASFGLPVQVRVVTSDRWRDELFRYGILDRDAKNPRQDFKRMREALAARSMIGERDGLIWNATPSAAAELSQAALASQNRV